MLFRFLYNHGKIIVHLKGGFQSLKMIRVKKSRSLMHDRTCLKLTRIWKVCIFIVSLLCRLFCFYSPRSRSYKINTTLTYKIVGSLYFFYSNIMKKCKQMYNRTQKFYAKGLQSSKSLTFTKGKNMEPGDVNRYISCKSG